MKKRNCLIEISFWIKVVSFLIVAWISYVGIRYFYDSYKESTKLVENTATVDKVAKDGEKTYVYLCYWVEAVYYKNIKVQAPKEYEKGQEITIYYDPFNPFDTERISFYGVKTENILYIALAAIPTLIMLGVLMLHYNKVRVHNNLLDNGMVIKALVLETSRQDANDLFAKLSRRKYIYGFRCEAEYMGEKYYFFRRDLYEDTSSLKGCYVNVYVDSDNEKNYYIVPKIATEDDGLGYNDESISGKISTATLSNDFDDFMKEIEK